MSNTAASSAPSMWSEDLRAPSGDSRGVRGRPTISDAIYFVVLALAVVFCLKTYPDSMDYYERIILMATVPLLVWMGWLWRPLRTMTVVVSLVALFAIWLYSPDGSLANGDINRSETVFFLKYLISSQSAILWMCALFVIATAMYWIGMVSSTAAWIGSGLTWAAVYAGAIGLLVRWREGHLLGPDIGHIPVSNLYEVFVLFALMTAMFTCITNVAMQREP